MGPIVFSLIVSADAPGADSFRSKSAPARGR
jgi:hypothetical protein